MRRLNGIIEKFAKAYNKDREPFAWRKREVKGAQIRDTIANDSKLNTSGLAGLDALLGKPLA